MYTHYNYIYSAGYKFLTRVNHCSTFLPNATHALLIAFVPALWAGSIAQCQVMYPYKRWYSLKRLFSTCA